MLDFFERQYEETKKPKDKKEAAVTYSRYRLWQTMENATTYDK